MDNSCKLIIILVFFLSINSVFALGVNRPYWSENPLKMYSGETREISFGLVNGVNEPTTEAVASITGEADIAQILSGNKYIVEPGSSNQKIRLKITMPSGETIGQNYNVKVFVTFSPVGEQGNIKLNVGYNAFIQLEPSGNLPFVKSAVIFAATYEVL